MLFILKGDNNYCLLYPKPIKTVNTIETRTIEIGDCYFLQCVNIARKNRVNHLQSVLFTALAVNTVSILKRRIKL